MKFPKSNKNKGFTLAELLVTIFIIGLLSSILVVNWRRNENQYQLQRVAQTVVQDIRKTQQMALTGSKYNGQLPNKNYGLVFSTLTPLSYKIFGDMNNNREYDSNDLSVADNNIESGFEIGLITVFRSQGGGTTQSVTIVYASFSLPDAFTTVKANISPPWQDSTTITVRKVGATCPSANCKNIIIKTTGQVSIQ